jgi:hypothetical protein
LLRDPATPPSPPLAEADVVIIIDRPDRPSSIVAPSRKSRKRNRRRRRPHHRIVRPAAAAPTRPIKQVEQPRARAWGQRRWSTLPSVLQNLPSLIDRPRRSRRHHPDPAKPTSSSSVAPIARAPSSAPNRNISDRYGTALCPTSGSNRSPRRNRRRPNCGLASPICDATRCGRRTRISLPAAAATRSYNGAVEESKLSA